MRYGLIRDISFSGEMIHIIRNFSEESRVYFMSLISVNRRNNSINLVKMVR